MKRRAPKTVLPALALAFLGAAAAVLADPQINSMPVGATIKGFVMPQRNDLGEVQANITGDQAHVVSESRIEITGLRVELFEAPGGGGAAAQASSKPDPTTVITSPFCDFWNQERRISSHRGVVVSRPEVLLTADAVDWDFKTQVAILHQNVKVVLSKFTIGAPPQAASSSAPALPTP